jgi:hypothetical protein
VTHLRKMMLEELQRRHYSEATTRRYIRFIERFAQHFHRSPDRLGPQHITFAAALRVSMNLGFCAWQGNSRPISPTRILSFSVPPQVEAGCTKRLLLLR